MPPTKPKPFTPRKLLVAVASVASMSYAAACSKPPPPTSGNLPAPEPVPTDAGAPIPPTSGNLMAPPSPDVAPLEVRDAGSTAAVKDAGALRDAGGPRDAGPPKKPTTKTTAPPPTSGNLMAPTGD